MSANLITLLVPAGLPQLWKDGHKAFAIKLISRTLQCLFAIIVIILYAVDLAKFSSANAGAPAAWIFAEVVATASLITCALHYFYTLESGWWTILDFVLCVLWSAQAGYFGTCFLQDDDRNIPFEIENITNRQNMKGGAGMGLACVILWLATFVQALVMRCKLHRKKRVNRKRIDRTIETVQVHCAVGRAMFPEERQISTRGDGNDKAENLPTYKEATTTQALAKQREALGLYDDGTRQNGDQ
ncbi:hypothetical protein PRZ48_006117 [Zasmidium cellare]|uniref:MARVEL domain-containing protein n=1 Tax=Zasmidium cellare TaxID=395010 RepID=A0ABR0EN44_ZASCE|nr:hypothetical protein PRZ48_006117 [Zasmidium cellare]